MAELNDAYRVLGDPDLRRAYDGDLADDDPPGRVEVVPPAPARPSGMPARLPWRAMVVAGFVGSVAVLVSSVIADPPSGETPDGIIRDGSCIAVTRELEAREVACGGDDDLVVELIVARDGTCPPGMDGYLDHLGLGRVCVSEAGR